MSHDDFDFEPAPGLPAPLPAGENLLWQGSPEWRSLAVRAYHVRKVAIYFALLVLWRVAVGIGNGHTAWAIVASSAFLIALGGLAIGVLTLLAYLNARSTVYSITTRRVLHAPWCRRTADHERAICGHRKRRPQCLWQRQW